MRKTAFISAALLALSLAACKGKGLTEDQCNKVIDHGIEVMVKGQGMKDISPDILKQAKEAAGAQLKEALDKCMKEGTQADFDCAMKASSMDEFMACDKS